MALGIPLWAMVELEADDALATAAARFAADPVVEQVLVCTPDKDLAQCVRDAAGRPPRPAPRPRLRRRRRPGQVGRAAGAIPDWLALVGDAADGFPGIPGFGAVTASARARRVRLAGGGPRRARGDLAGLASAARRAWPRRSASAGPTRSSSASWRRCGSTPRSPSRTIDELRWRGTDRVAWEAFCERWDLPGLRRRPHRWRAPRLSRTRLRRAAAAACASTPAAASEPGRRRRGGTDPRRA